MRYDWRNNSALFVHNLDSKPREISFTTGIESATGKLLVNLLSEDHSWANEQGLHHLLLEAYAYRWYRVGGLDYLLKRSEIDVQN
jgi:maltose alpha-D-glucosyltransferase/alpha-amylase